MSTDVELLERWRSGDLEAGNVLFERHFPAVYGFFRNKAGAGIDDLVQKTFVACVEGRDKLAEDASFRAYMFGAARRILYREYDRRHRDAKNLDYGVTSVHDLDPSPSRIAVQKQEQRLLLQALRMIPLKHQVALELYYVQGIRGPQLAAVLDVPEGTVRSRLKRGLEKLRAKVETLTTSPELLESTIGGLETWAAGLQEPLSPAAAAAPA